jgi:hypothetical protein
MHEIESGFFDSYPEQYGFNVACLEGVNPLVLENIPTYDGVNHPADRV